MLGEPRLSNKQGPFFALPKSATYSISLRNRFVPVSIRMETIHTRLKSRGTICATAHCVVMQERQQNTGHERRSLMRLAAAGGGLLFFFLVGYFLFFGPLHDEEPSYPPAGGNPEVERKAQPNTPPSAQ